MTAIGDGELWKLEGVYFLALCPVTFCFCLELLGKCGSYWGGMQMAAPCLAPALLVKETGCSSACPQKQELPLAPRLLSSGSGHSRALVRRKLLQGFLSQQSLYW